MTEQVYPVCINYYQLVFNTSKWKVTYMYNRNICKISSMAAVTVSGSSITAGGITLVIVCVKVIKVALLCFTIL